MNYSSTPSFLGLIALALWEASCPLCMQLEQCFPGAVGACHWVRLGIPGGLPLSLAATTLLRGKQTQPPRAGVGGRERHRQPLCQGEDCVPAQPFSHLDKK